MGRGLGKEKIVPNSGTWSEGKNKRGEIWERKQTREQQTPCCCRNSRRRTDRSTRSCSRRRSGRRRPRRTRRCSRGATPPPARPAPRARRSPPPWCVLNTRLDRRTGHQFVEPGTQFFRSRGRGGGRVPGCRHHVFTRTQRMSRGVKQGSAHETPHCGLEF